MKQQWDLKVQLQFHRQPPAELPVCVCSGVLPSPQHQLPVFQRHRVHVQRERAGLLQNRPLQERVSDRYISVEDKLSVGLV